jgi:hypothetical protein
MAVVATVAMAAMIVEGEMSTTMRNMEEAVAIAERWMLGVEFSRREVAEDSKLVGVVHQSSEDAIAMLLQVLLQARLLVIIPCYFLGGSTFSLQDSRSSFDRTIFCRCC